MKKILFITGILSSLLFFSCASKKTAENEEPLTPIESSAISTDSTLNKTNEEEITEEEKPSEDENTLPSQKFDIPEEIEEPVVRDLPLEETVETIKESVTEEKDDEVTVLPVEEPVSSSDIDILEPIPESLKTDTNPVVTLLTDNSKSKDDEIVNTTDKDTTNELNENNEVAVENPTELDNTSSSENLPENTETSLDSENINTQVDTTTDNSENTPVNETEDEELEDEIVIVPSRSVKMKVGDSLEVVYPGSGWIYMGSLSEFNNLASKGRKLGATDTKYTLLAKEEGTQIHHFYKTDNLTNNYIDDYLEVIVVAKRGASKAVVTAPAYAEIVPEKAVSPAKSTKTLKKEAQKAEEQKALEAETSSAKTENKTESKNNNSSTVSSENNNDEDDRPIEERQYYVSFDDKPAKTNKVETEDKIEDVISIDSDNDILFEADDSEIDTNELLSQAKALFAKKEFKQAELILMDFFEYATDNRDEALYIQGQILESDGPSKNIKGAISAYENLTKNYPASPYWEKANKRIIYLKRFYIDVH